MSKKFLVPVGAAVAALIANASDAANLPPETQKDSMELQTTTKAEDQSAEMILQRLIYRIKEQTHALLLRKSSSGILYAGHGSHQSHHSHSSHRSGR